MTRNELKENLNKRAVNKKDIFNSFNHIYKDKEDTIDIYDIVVELYNYRDMFAKGDSNYSKITNMIEEIESKIISYIVLR